MTRTTWHHRPTIGGRFGQLFCVCFLGLVFATGQGRAAETVAVYPDQLHIGSADQQHRVLVVATDAAGMTRDVSGAAEFAIDKAEIAEFQNGRLLPQQDGQAVLQVTFADATQTIPITVTGVAQRPATSFNLDVMPVFAKSGCNTGTCHGSARGQDGFRLSLFGFDPAGDYQRITRELGARRLNLALPEKSLLLEKAIAAVPHTGGKRFEVDSEYYRSIYDWIREGAPKDGKETAHVTGLELFPPEAVLRGGGQSQPLLARASYSDGTTRDVSNLAVFISRDEGVAAVTAAGIVTAGRRGESFVTARFDAYTVGIPVVVLPADSQFEPTATAGNYIDELVQTKLTKLHFQPAAICSDAEFLRRVSLDVVGQLPTEEQFATFVANESPNKRAELIDELLARPEFTDLWANTWADLLMIRPKQQPYISPKSAYLYFHWLRDEIAKGTRFDEIVRQILTASGGGFESPATGFYAAETDRLKVAENVAQAFLGIRTQCAQCHNHPFDRWTMDDYYGFAAFFTKVRRKKGEDDREWIVFPGGGNIKHPVTGQVVGPKYLGGDSVDKPPADPRLPVADWIASPDNPYFAKNIANRLWAHFFGQGIVEPVDDVRISNPPVNGPLYEKLSRRLVAYEFDIRKLATDILNSQAYQRTAMVAGDLALKRNFGQSSFRRIPAAILLDCIDQVTGSPSKHRSVPANTRAVQLPSEASDNYFLTTFGRSTRNSVCACESKSEPTLSQALHMINGDSVHGKIAQGKLIQSWLEQKKEPADVIQTLYVRCLNRKPTAEEQSRLLATVEAAANPEQGLEDLFWALLNSREFLFNH